MVGGAEDLAHFRSPRGQGRRVFYPAPLAPSTSLRPLRARSSGRVFSQQAQRRSFFMRDHTEDLQVQVHIYYILMMGAAVR